MALGFADPFDTLFRFQRALDQQLDSDWLEDATGGVGAFPPINVFRQGGDFVSIIEMPGVSKDDLGLEVRGNAIRISGKKTIDSARISPTIAAPMSAPRIEPSPPITTTAKASTTNSIAMSSEAADVGTTSAPAVVPSTAPSVKTAE